MPGTGYCVYWVRGRTRRHGSLREYVGAAECPPGVPAAQAAQDRVARHAALGDDCAAWLLCVSLDLSSVLVLWAGDDLSACLEVELF